MERVGSGAMAQAAAPDREALRRLAELRLDRPVVLSLYLDLDPSALATPPARATAVRSLLDEAGRRLRELEGLSHQDRRDLDGALERASSFLGEGPNIEGTDALALFVCEPEDLFEVVALPQSVRSRVVIDRSPFVGPLAGLERRERWCVTLVSRRDARVFLGSPEGLREVDAFSDDVHGQHDQGGWSQARYQRRVEKDKEEHLKRAAEVLQRRLRRKPFERLVVGGPHEIVADFKSKLHPYLAERLSGEIEVDVETANPDAVLAAAGPLLDELEERREADALQRVGEAAGGPARAVAGLADVLGALNERRVETLLLGERFSAAGTECPACGWLGEDGVAECPADGTALVTRDDVVEPAIELALQQSAGVLPVRRLGEQLEAHGGIAALLRF
jgi:peptide chain release factor subunit 1